MCDAAGSEAWSWDITIGIGWKSPDARTTNGVTKTSMYQNNFEAPTPWGHHEKRRAIERGIRLPQANGRGTLRAGTPPRSGVPRQRRTRSDGPQRPLRTIDEDGGLEFRSDVGGEAPVVKRIPVEAEAKDDDGFRVHALLHVVGGRPTELEIYKDDGSRVKRIPPASAFELIVLPPVPSKVH
jgi:hypothetical protein